MEKLREEIKETYSKEKKSLETQIKSQAEVINELK